MTRPLPQPSSPPPSSWQAFAPGLFGGHVVLVTGAASGIGRATAEAFHGLGATVVATDRDADGLGRLAAELPEGRVPDRLTTVACDVADPAAVDALFAEVDARHGRLDHLVHCAAVITARRAAEITPDDWHRVLDVNLVGAFSVLMGALRRMLAAGTGTIVAVGSDAGKRGGGGLVADAAYAASKAGVLSVVKSLAREHAGRGVRINALTPGPTDTPMHGALPADLKERIASGLPVGRMGQAVDLAAGAVFLSSPAAEFVYASSMNVDGGALYE